MATCPLCSDILLRHIRPGQPYWLCRRCRLEISGKNYPMHECSSVALPLISIERSLSLQANVLTDHPTQQLPAMTTEV